MFVRDIIRLVVQSEDMQHLEFENLSLNPKDITNFDFYNRSINHYLPSHGIYLRYLDKYKLDS